MESSPTHLLNVRRVMDVLHKAIRKSSKHELFADSGINEDTKKFLNGLYGYTPVIDNDDLDTYNGYLNIYVKPTKTIDFIQLNFIKTKSGLSFDEVTGSFQGEDDITRYNNDS